MGFRQKLLQSIFILFFALKTYPVRLYRIIVHFLPLRYKLGGEIKFPFLILEWFVSLILYVGDLVFLPEIICVLYVIINKDVRGLTPKEKQIKNLLFENKLNIPILLNDKANVLTKDGKIAFVSFYIINSTGMSDRTFAHELIHIYQFSRYGSPYIIRALLAQRTISAYDYGGTKNLLKFYENNLSQGNLNYEQQGDVLADYFILIKNKDQLDTPKYLYLKSLYEHIVNQWLRKDIYRW